MDDASYPCPVCGTVVGWPPPDRCGRCATELLSDDVRKIRALDDKLWQIGAERRALVFAIRERTSTVSGTADAPSNAASPPPVAHPAPSAAPRRTSRLRHLSAESLLAAAGVALLVLAAIVFAAVTWQQLGAWSRVAILIASTMLAAAGTTWLARTGLRVTAEAVGVLAVLLALVTLHGARVLDIAGLEAVSLAAYLFITSPLVAAVAVGLARWSKTSAAEIGGIALLLVPFPALAVELAGRFEISIAVAGGMILLGGAVTLEALRRAEFSTVRATAPILRWGAISHLVLAVVAALASSADDSLVAATLGGLLTGLFAAGLAWLDRSGWFADAVATLAASAPLAILAGIHLLPDAPAVAAALVAVCVAALVSALPDVRRSSVIVGAIPVLGLILEGLFELRNEFLEATLVIFADVWAVAPPAVGDGWAVLLLLFTTAALALFAAGAGSRSAATIVAGAGSVLTLFVATAAFGTPVALRCGVGVLAIAIVVAASFRHRLPAGASAAVMVASVWTLGWALVGPWLTVTVLATLAGGLGAWVLLVPREHLRDFDIGVLVVTAVAAGVSLPGVTVVAAGGEASVAGFVTVVAAASLLVVASRLADRRLLVVLESIAYAGFLGGLQIAEPHAALFAGGFAISGAAAAVHALRPDRRWAAVLAILLLSASSWALLGDAEVELIEAYAAIPAALTLLVGSWRLVRDDDAGSLAALSVGLILALGPTAGQVLEEPTDVVRVLALATAGAVVLAVGAFGRLAAPTVYGAGAVGVVVLTQLWVAASHLPRWVTFATLGLLLIFGSATYERQRTAMARTRTRVAALR